MKLHKDYSSCPPKKRLLNAWIIQDNIKGKVIDENEEPQDLSLKCRARALDSVPCCANDSLFFANDISGFISRKAASTSLSSRNSSVLKETSFPATGNEGLHLIAGVSPKVGNFRPSVVQEPITATSNSLRNKNVGTSCSPLSAVGVTNRGSKTSSTYHHHHHPYISFGIYSLPYTSYPLTKPLKNQVETPEVKLTTIDASTSSPKNSLTETSSESEGSPELRREKITCKDCGRGYATETGIARHHQFHCSKDASRSFLCKHCDKTYTSMGALKMHIRTHTLPCKCQVCGKAFSRPWLLQGHIRTHTGEKPFQCQQCLRSFADRSNLRAHLQTHEDIKKYGCKLCPKTFSRMSLLVKHQDHGCRGATNSKIFSLRSALPIQHLR